VRGVKKLAYLLALLPLAACNSEREPEKAGPGEGFVWPGSAVAQAPAPMPMPPPQPLPRPPPPPPPAATPSPPPAPSLINVEKKLVYSDNFDRADLGADWQFQGGNWMIKEGTVHSTMAQNKCLWLKRPIPADAVVELEAWSMSPRGDIKFTVFGDGVEHETGYTLILGGWVNSISIIARMDEHGADRKERHDRGVVVPGKHYRFEMRRLGGRIEWFVDGALYLTYDDASPLRGPGHDHFAFCNWESPLFFDNLKIYALSPKGAAPGKAP
jgi:hypothetical protein